MFWDDEHKRSVAKGTFAILLSRLFTIRGSQALIDFIAENFKYLTRPKCSSESPG